MNSQFARIATGAVTAALAAAILVGVIDSAQVAATVTGSPAVTTAAFATFTPAIGSLA